MCPGRIPAAQGRDGSAAAFVEPFQKRIIGRKTGLEAGVFHLAGGVRGQAATHLIPLSGIFPAEKATGHASQEGAADSLCFHLLWK